MNKSKLMDLDIRLGYKDEITLTRNEFKELIEGDPADIADLNDEISDLENDYESLKNENKRLENEIDYLEADNEKLEAKIKQLKEKNNE